MTTDTATDTQTRQLVVFTIGAETPRRRGA